MTGRAAGLALALALGVALAGTALAQRAPLPRTTAHDDLRVTVDDAWPPVGPGLLFPVRVTLHNGGDAREVEVRWQASDPADRVNRQISLDTGQTARFSLLVPRAGRHFASTFSVLVDGKEIEQLRDRRNDWYDLDKGTLQGPGRIRGRGILVVDQVKPDLRQLEGGWNDEYLATVVLTPDRLAETWQSYDGLRLVLVEGRAWASLDPAHRRAIETAVKAGALIVFYGQIDQGVPPEGGFGLGTVRHHPGDAFTRGGISFWLGAAGGDAWNARRLTPKKNFDGFEIPGVGKVPLVALKFILLVFVLLVGPVNLFVTWYVLKKRPLLLVTTPLLALLGSGLLFAWSFASEGFGVKSRSISWTWLDPDSEMAVVRQESALYAGLTPSGGLTFDPETALWIGNRDEVRDSNPAGRGGYGYGYSGPEVDASRTLEVDEGSGLVVRSGGLPARRMTWLVSGRVLQVRSRLALEPSGGGLALVNGLSASLVGGAVVAPGGGYLVFDDEVAPGGRVDLEPRSTLDYRRDGEIPPWLKKDMMTVPGSYLIVLEENPWLENGIEGADTSGGLHLLTGRLELP